MPQEILDNNSTPSGPPVTEVERNQEREKLATRLLMDLIKIPSVTNTEHECEPVDALIDFFEKYGKDCGVTCRVIESGTKRNLVAEVGNESDGRPVLLNAHFDVVRTDDKKMFDPRIENGAVYGRGACDDKGGLVAMAMTMLEIAKAGKHKGKVIFCAVGGEEGFTQYGTEKCIDEKVVANNVIVAEPTNGVVVVGHAGQANFAVEIEGTEAHSSTPELGRNAIIRRYAVERALRRNLKLAHDPRWPNPPTLTVTGDKSGGVNSAVPGHAEATFNIRPQEDPKNIFVQVQEILSKLRGTSFRVLSQATPCVFKENSDLVRAALQVTRQEKAVCVPWRSDAVPYEKHPLSKEVADGIIVYGPGNIKYAHGPNEQIQVADILKVAREYQEIIELCQNPDLIKK